MTEQRPLPTHQLVDGTSNRDDFPDDLAAAAQLELVHLWSDLGEARRSALDGVWSMECDNLVYRIVMLSRLVGATPWGEIGFDVLRDGLYERLYDEAGIDYEPVDHDKVAELAAYIENGRRSLRA